MKTMKSTWILRCPDCKAHVRLEAGSLVELWNGKPAVRCSCGRTMIAKRLKGRVSSDHVCDARCLASKGYVCECSCGGENHGRAA